MNMKVMRINKSKGSPRGHTPSLRRCVVCRQMKEKAALSRVVRSAEGEFLVDGTMKAAGRGAYLCHDEDCHKKCAKTRAFDRSFKQKVPQEVYDGIITK